MLNISGWTVFRKAALVAAIVPATSIDATVVFSPEYERHLSIDVVVNPDGSHVDHATMSVKRLTSGSAPNGDQITELIPLDSAYTKVLAIRATIIDKSGTRRELTSEAVKTSPMRDGPMIGVETGTLTEIQTAGFDVGDVLELSAMFETAARFAGTFTYHMPQQSLCGSARVAFHLPKAMRFSYEAHGIELTKKQDDSRITYSGAISHDDDQIHQCGFGAGVKFDLVASSLSNYSELAQLYGDRIATQDDIPSEVRALANDITKGVEDRRQQAILLHEWVSQKLALIGPSPNIRYGYPGRAQYFMADIDWGLGANVLHALLEVIRAGKGSSLDHVRVYRALLKAKGIDADLVLLNGGEDFSLASPATLYPFTGALVWLPEFAVYDDESAGSAPFGTMPFLDYGKPVLHLGKSEPALRRTPILQPEQVSLAVATHVKLASDGTFTGTSQAVASGPFIITLKDIATAIHAEGGDAPAGMALTWRPRHAKFVLGTDRPEDSTFAISEEFSSSAPPPGTLPGGSTLDPYRKFLFQAIGVAGLHGLEDQLPIANNTHNWDRGVNIFGARVPKPGEILLEPAMMDSSPFPRPTMKPPFTCIPGRYTEDLSIQFPENQRPGVLPKSQDISNDDISYLTLWTFHEGTLTVHRELISKVPGPSSCGAKDQQLVEEVLKQVDSDFEPSIPLEHLH